MAEMQKYRITTTPGGSAVMGCSCLAKWWPVVNELAAARGFVKETLDVSQGSYRGGLTAASAGTHDGGGVLDLVQHSDDLSLLLRECGAAAFERDSGKFKNNRHTHLVLVGCPHLHWEAVAQVTEWRNGGDGLVGNLPDPDPRPARIRSWAEGLDWARDQLTRERENMPLNDNDLTRIESLLRETVNAVDLANQRRIDKLAASVAELTRIATETQRRLGWQAKNETISEQIK